MKNLLIIIWIYHNEGSDSKQRRYSRRGYRLCLLLIYRAYFTENLNPGNFKFPHLVQRLPPHIFIIRCFQFIVKGKHPVIDLVQALPQFLFRTFLRLRLLLALRFQHMTKCTNNVCLPLPIFQANSQIEKVQIIIEGQRCRFFIALIQVESPLANF